MTPAALSVEQQLIATGYEQTIQWYMDETGLPYNASAEEITKILVKSANPEVQNMVNLNTCISVWCKVVPLETIGNILYTVLKKHRLHIRRDFIYSALLSKGASKEDAPLIVKSAFAIVPELNADYLWVDIDAARLIQKRLNIWQDRNYQEPDYHPVPSFLVSSPTRRQVPVDPELQPEKIETVISSKEQIKAARIARIRNTIGKILTILGIIGGVTAAYFITNGWAGSNSLEFGTTAQIVFSVITAVLMGGAMIMFALACDGGIDYLKYWIVAPFASVVYASLLGYLLYIVVIVVVVLAVLTLGAFGLGITMFT
jgi:hypothetical protein